MTKTVRFLNGKAIHSIAKKTNNQGMQVTLCGIPEGRSYAEIGCMYRLTRQRIREICLDIRR